MTKYSATAVPDSPFGGYTLEGDGVEWEFEADTYEDALAAILAEYNPEAWVLHFWLTEDILDGSWSIGPDGKVTQLRPLRWEEQ